jgi:hypothetical protein
LGLFIDSVEQATNLTNGKRHRLWFYIYGFNIAVLSSLLAMLFSRLLGRWRAAVATVVGITFYTILVGADPSVVWAPVMGSLPYSLVATNDFQGLPSPETLQAIKDYSLLRTDQNGWIELTTEGKQMWVEVEGR